MSRSDRNLYLLLQLFKCLSNTKTVSPVKYGGSYRLSYPTEYQSHWSLGLLPKNLMLQARLWQGLYVSQASPHLSVLKSHQGWCRVLKPSLTVSPPAKRSTETRSLRTLKVKDRGLVWAAETISITVQRRRWYPSLAGACWPLLRNRSRGHVITQETAIDFLRYVWWQNLQGQITT